MDDIYDVWHKPQHACFIYIYNLIVLYLEMSWIVAWYNNCGRTYFLLNSIGCVVCTVHPPCTTSGTMYRMAFLCYWILLVVLCVRFTRLALPLELCTVWPCFVITKLVHSHPPYNTFSCISNTSFNMYSVCLHTIDDWSETFIFEYAAYLSYIIIVQHRLRACTHFLIHLLTS